jgi:hypothetical protein
MRLRRDCPYYNFTQEILLGAPELCTRRAFRIAGHARLMPRSVE